MWISPPNSPTFGISYTPDLHAASKIVGGNIAFPGEFPYQLQLQGPTGDHRCGAVLITTLLALTAAHCVLGITANDLKLVSGQHLRQQIDGTEQSRDVREIFVHENYSLLRNTDDIALLVLAKEFLITDEVNNAVLVNETTKLRDFALASGWGRVKEMMSSLGAALKKVFVPIVPLEMCRKSYSEYTLPETIICAGSLGSDACNGDSGGPLTCIGESGERYLCGIVSWGKGCGREGYPTVYTKVSMYTTWIQKKISVLRTRNLCPLDSNRCSLNFNSAPLQETYDPCSLDEFPCRMNKKCIPLAFRCDEELDCGEGDRSDEFGCPVGTGAPDSCDSDQFQCELSKRCISGRYKCDGDNDCQLFHPNDKSDEEKCEQASAAPSSCTSSQFQCKIRQRCIRREYVCDGDNDCGYGDLSDEANCTNHASSTPMPTFAGAETTPLPCRLGQFQCKINKGCVPLLYVCDGDDDCGSGDRSDEESCFNSSDETMNELLATFTTTGSPSTSNENVTQTGCTLEEFQCSRSKTCIPLSFRCDNEYDCDDGDTSDEENCGAGA